MTAKETKLGPQELDRLLDQLLAACQTQDIGRLRKLITEAPTGYKPDEHIVDLLWDEDAHLTPEILRAGE